MRRTIVIHSNFPGWFYRNLEYVCVSVCVCVSQSVSKTHSPQTMIEQFKYRLK